MGKPLQQPLGDISREEFNQLIHLFLDGEATAEEVAYIESKCESCENSAKYYDTECDFYQMVKSKLNRAAAPSELISQIRKTISSNSPAS